MAEETKTDEEWMADLKSAEAAGNLPRANAIREAYGMPRIGQEGAGFGARTTAAASRGPGAQLAAVQNVYGPGNVSPFGGDNFIVPGDTGPTLFNPPGFDVGDLSAGVRPVAEGLGALTGGAAGILGGIPGIMLGAGLGGETAGTLYDYGMRAFGGAEDTRSAGERLVDTAMGAAFNTMGGAIPRPYGMIDDVAELAGRNTFGRAMKDAEMPPLTSGQQGSTIGQRAEGWLESTLTGGPAIDTQRSSVAEGLQNYVEKNFPVELSRDEAGDLAAQGVESVVKGKRVRGSELYDELNNLINAVDEGRLSIPESQKILADFEEKMARDPAYAGLINTDPDLKRYVDTLKKALSEEEAQFPLYNTIKEYRTTVGANLNPMSITAQGGVEREKRRLYGALSDDLAEGAEEIAGFPARQARSRADWYNRGLMGRMEKIDPAFKYADNPTKVYDALGLMVRNNPSALSAAKKTMPDDVWNDFASTYFRRLMAPRPGNATGDSISYQTMATNLNKLRRESPESWELLAGENARALENIQALANKFRESERFFNRSRTANALGLGQLSGATSSGAAAGYLLGNTPEAALTGGAATLLTSTVVPWLTSKAMTSPTIRRAVEKMPVNLLSDNTSPRAIAMALVAAGADEDEVRELIAMER